MKHYEIWDIETGNLVEVFDDCCLEEAKEAARWYRDNWTPYPDRKREDMVGLCSEDSTTGETEVIPF